MKIKLAILNLSLIFFIAGLFVSVRYGMKAGIVFVLIASLIITVFYYYFIIRSLRQKKLWTVENLLLTLIAGILFLIFIHGFFLSVDLFLLNINTGFMVSYHVTGFLIIAIFLYTSIQSFKKLKIVSNRSPVFIFYVIISSMLLVGSLGKLYELPTIKWFLFYAEVCLLSGILAFGLYMVITKSHQSNKEIWMISILSIVVILLLVIKYYLPEVLTGDLLKAILFIGFIPVVILPITIMVIKKYRFFTITILVITFLDLLVLQAGPNWYYQLVYYGINRTPDVPMEELLEEPSEEEIQQILTEWNTIDFSPRDIKIEFEEIKPNGDSLKVVSHTVDGHKHYGIIRIPKNIDTQKAPILFALPGGGLHLDILHEKFLYNLGGKSCPSVLDSFITIAPSYRGKVLKGENYCFISGGFEGDALIGATEDAVAFLETIKQMYNKDDSTKVLTYGVSKGGTIALIAGSFTNKMNYIIASSAFSKFLDKKVVEEKRIGGVFSSAFYAQNNTPINYRKRILAGSPYYFARHLPPFELHQGSDDFQHLPWHAEQLQNQLEAMNKRDDLHHIYIHEGKGHGYFDASTVCQSIENFLEM